MYNYIQMESIEDFVLKYFLQDAGKHGYVAFTYKYLSVSLIFKN